MMKRILCVAALLFATGVIAVDQYHRPGKITAGTKIFPEVQMEYGLHNNFYHHGHWNDRPLFADRSIRDTGSVRQPQMAASILREAGLLKFYNAAGFAPQGDPGQIKFILDTYAKNGEKETLILPSIYPPVTEKGYRDTEENFYRTVALNKEPNLYRIKDKMVISSYFAGLVSPEKWKSILEKARREHGDVFMLVAAVSPQIQRYSSRFMESNGNPDPETVRDFENTLQAYLDVCDGIMVGYSQRRIDPDGLYGELEIPGLAEHLTVLIRRVMARPQNHGKLLAATVHLGYVNRMSGYVNYEHGTQMLRQNLAFAEALDPDYIQAFEWNEWNENTCFMPTVRRGNSTGRILRYAQSRLDGTRPVPAPEDDLSIPNWILSYRFSLKAGEKFSFELLNVPDGTRYGKTSGILKLYDLKGKLVHTFPAVSLGDDTMQAESLELPTEDFAEYPALNVELEIKTADGQKRVFNGYPVIRLHPSQNMEYMFVRLPLRENAAIQTELNVGEERNGVRRVTGKVISDSPLNSVELLCNGNVMRYVEKNPEFDQNQETVIRVRAESWGWKHVKGNLRMLNASQVKARSAQFDGNHHFVDNFRRIADGVFTDIWTGGHGTRNFFFAIPNKETSSAEFFAELDKIQFKVPVADIVRFGTVGREEGGIFWRFDRMDLAPDLGFPLKTQEISFDYLVRTKDPAPVFQLRSVTMNGRRNWGKPVQGGEFKSAPIEIPVWSETQKKRIVIRVAGDRIPDARYIFEPERGTVLDSNLNREYIGELGAGYHYCQANQKESYNNPPNDFRKAAPDWISADGVPALKFDGMYDNLTFYPTAFPLGAFTVDFEIKPDDGYDMLLMRHDNGNQVTGLSVFIVNGKLAIGYVRKTGEYSYMPTEFPVSPGKWSNVRITYDLQEFRVIVNGQEMRQEGSGRGMSTESLIFGSTSSRSFLPNPQIKNFKGELRSLRIYQNATN